MTNLPHLDRCQGSGTPSGGGIWLWTGWGTTARQTYVLLNSTPESDYGDPTSSPEKQQNLKVFV